MLSQEDIDLLRSFQAITSTDDNILINFTRIMELGLVLLHSRGMVWFQPHDKEIIPDGVEIITNPKFLQQNPSIKLCSPFRIPKDVVYGRRCHVIRTK